MKTDYLSPAVILVGIILMVAGRFEYAVEHGASGWTREDAKAFSAAGAQFHQLAHEHSEHAGKPSEQLPAEFQEAKQEFERQKVRLNNARNRGMILFQVIRWSGVGLTIAGIIRFLTLRVQNENA